MNFKNHKVAVISDLHLGIHQNNPIWHNISLDFAKWFKQELIKNQIQDVVIAGDINNDRNELSVNSMNIIKEIFQLWSNFNVTVLVGNHDAYYKDRPDIHSLSLLSGWNNINVIDKLTTINQFGKQISFCPWGVTLDQIPNSDIVFGHFAITGFKMTKGKICTEGFECEDLLNKTKLIITGHFHLKEERKYSEGTILYLGCPYELSWSDYCDLKGYHICDLQQGSYEFVENKISPKHKKIMLSELADLQKISEDIKKEIEGNIVALIVDKEVNHNIIEKLSTILVGFKPLTFRVDYIQNNKLTLDQNEINIDNIDIGEAITEFVNILQINEKEKVLSYVLDLYKKLA